MGHARCSYHRWRHVVTSLEKIGRAYSCMSIAWRYRASALRWTYCIEMLGPAAPHPPRVLGLRTVAMCHNPWRQQLLFRDWSERRCYPRLRWPLDAGAPVEADVGITVGEVDCITSFRAGCTWPFVYNRQLTVARTMKCETRENWVIDLLLYVYSAGLSDVIERHGLNAR